MTAANSSSISDGAAALVMMRRSSAEKRGLAPLATVVGHATHSQEPAWFTTAPVGAMKKLFEKTRWSASQVDLYEINEAFAVVTMAAMKEHGLPHDKVNVHGGACALGHPIGASGARIVVNAHRRAAQVRVEARRGQSCASAAAKPPRWRSNASDQVSVQQITLNALARGRLDLEEMRKVTGDAVAARLRPNGMSM